MFTHKALWSAIDKLAASHGLSASALARRSGLDATAFNPSKRTGPDGRERWPSTGSLAQVLQATGTSLADFVALLQPGPVLPKAIPVIGLAQAGQGGFFDDAGFPVGGGWEEVAFPDLKDPNAFALEISGDSMQPVFRPGQIVVVSPAANIGIGDRVVAKTRDGEVMAKELKQQNARRVVLQSANPDYEDRILPAEEVNWIARIIWAQE